MAVPEHVDEQVDGDDRDVVVVVRARGRRDQQRVEERHPRQVVRERHPRRTRDLEQLVRVALEVVGRGADDEATRGPGHEAVVTERPDGELAWERGQQAVEIRRIQQGRNHLATDTRNGRKLMLLAERRGTKVRVVGFMIQERDGRYFRLPDANSHEGKPGDSFGCPDGWDAKIICYTHPTYNVTVCYTRCTPTQLTLQLPSGL